ncbi:MAG: helix-turn-helix transcriptional regulator [Evtepia sp.]
MRLAELKQEHLANPNVKREYDALEPEFQLIRALIDARKKKNLSQQQLADQTGIHRADISKLENGNANPSLKLLKRLAAGMDMNIKIEFVPR